MKAASYKRNKADGINPDNQQCTLEEGARVSQVPLFKSSKLDETNRKKNNPTFINVAATRIVNTPIGLPIGNTTDVLMNFCSGYRTLKPPSSKFI